MKDYVRIGFDWKGGNPTDEIKKLEKIGLFVCPTPSSEGSDYFGFFVSQKPMTDEEIELADEEY